MAGKYIQKNCLACGDIFEARLADHKRGWGKCCDKSCAAAYKAGCRPKDVNANHAKYSVWADQMMRVRRDMYEGGTPPKAPSIESQIGKRVKVKRPKSRSYPRNDISESERAHQDACDAMELGWDSHKVFAGSPNA